MHLTDWTLSLSMPVYKNTVTFYSTKTSIILLYRMDKIFSCLVCWHMHTHSICALPGTSFVLCAAYLSTVPQSRGKLAQETEQLCLETPLVKFCPQPEEHTSKNFKIESLLWQEKYWALTLAFRQLATPKKSHCKERDGEDAWHIWMTWVHEIRNMKDFYVLLGPA